MNGSDDILYPFLGLYNRLPLSVRRILGWLYNCLPISIRNGKFYKTYLKRIDSFQTADKNALGELSSNLIFNQINFAINHVPFYKHYKLLHNIDDIEKLPIVNKEFISQRFDVFINPQKNTVGLKSNTGGSCGSPFNFLIEKNTTRPKELAHFNWYWGKYGYSVGDKILMIRGKSLPHNALFEYQPIGNKLAVSCYNINQKSIAKIYDKILKFKPAFIHAYPSALLTFTKELQQYLNNKKLPFVFKAIFLGSEYLFNNDKKFFETYYQSKVINWYGHSECLIHGGRCELSGDYHFYPFYGYLELVDEEDKVINEPGVAGRIVATGFDNSVMPLIRYDTGDIGIYSDKQECECGFKGKSLAKIVGRGKDYIVLKDGTQVSLTAFIFGQHHEEFTKIKELQIEQTIPGEILVRVNPLGTLDDSIFNSLHERLIKSVPAGMLSITIQTVKEIEKTHRGKHKILIQNIDK